MLRPETVKHLGIALDCANSPKPRKPETAALQFRMVLRTLAISDDYYHKLNRFSSFVVHGIACPHGIGLVIPLTVTFGRADPALKMSLGALNGDWNDLKRAQPSRRSQNSP